MPTPNVWKLGPYNLIIEEYGPTESGWGLFLPKGTLFHNDYEEPLLFEDLYQAERVKGKSFDLEDAKIVFVRGYPGRDGGRWTYVIEAWRES
jgi:hypothetical protein